VQVFKYSVIHILGRVCAGQEHTSDCRYQSVIGYINRAFCLRRTSCKVHVHLITFNSHFYLNRERTVPHDIFIHHAAGRINPIRNLTHLAARKLGTVLNQTLDCLIHCPGTIFPAYFNQTFLSCPEPGNLSPHIPDRHIREPYIAADNLYNCFIDFTFLKQFQAGELKSFLIDFGGIHCIAGILSPQFRPVALIDTVSKKLAVNKDRKYQPYILQMGPPAAVRIITDNQIAFLKISLFRIFFNYGVNQ